MSMMGSITPDMMASDAAAFFDYLAARPEVSGDAFGTTGYCMGGRTSLVVAGRVPERVAAAMSFHGGGLATDDPGSPHLLADQIGPPSTSPAPRTTRHSPPSTAETLDKALTAAGVDAHRSSSTPRRTGSRSPTIRRTTRMPPSGTGSRCRGFLRRAPET